MTEYLELKATDCMHCYRCIRNCPVKAISYSAGQANIVQEECVLCGRCFVSCPQNAKRIRFDLPKAKALLAENQQVVASIAPAFAANYPQVTIGGLRRALQKLGFAQVEETAVGATIVKQQYDALVEEEKQSVVVSTCCHTVNSLVQKHFPAVLPYLADMLSPMQAHCTDIKSRYPGAKTVFIGPCISKKQEAQEYPGIVDCVLTFEELDIWLEEEGVALETTALRKDEEGGRARLFPTTGGILRTMKKSNPRYSYISVDGMDNCIKALEDIAAGHLQNCFVEMSACNGSCIGGPAMSNDAGLIRGYISVDGYAPLPDFEVQPYSKDQLRKNIAFSAVPAPRFSNKAIEEVLKKIGKNNPEDELNCGSCGYDTCREKAQAVLAGKANLEMCLPYLMSKAQSFSDTIIRNTPNGVIVLDDALEIQQINAAACRMLHVARPADVMGRNVVCVMEPEFFLEVLETEAPVYDKRQYLAEYGLFVKMTVIQDKDYGLMIGIMRDITENETTKAARREVAEKTIRVTDEVIDRQMRTVQEIASLLGETAAETKIALTKLKETLSDD